MEWKKFLGSSTWANRKRKKKDFHKLIKIYKKLCLEIKSKLSQTKYSDANDSSTLRQRVAKIRRRASGKNCAALVQQNAIRLSSQRKVVKCFRSKRKNHVLEREREKETWQKTSFQSRVLSRETPKEKRFIRWLKKFRLYTLRGERFSFARLNSGIDWIIEHVVVPT